MSALTGKSEESIADESIDNLLKGILGFFK